MAIGKYVAMAALCAGIGMYAANCSDGNKTYRKAEKKIEKLYDGAEDTYEDAEKKLKKTHRNAGEDISDTMDDLKKKKKEAKKDIGEFVEDFGEDLQR